MGMLFGQADHWLLLAGGGFLVGLLVGVTGVGAGSLTTPMLISGFGVSPVVAVGTDLLFACITKASAAWRHQKFGNIDWNILKSLMSGSLPAALLVLLWLLLNKPDTAWLSHAIRRGLSVALIASAIAIAVYPWIVKIEQSRHGSIEPAPSHHGWTIALGAVLGCLVALTSVGAGAIGVVALSALFPALAARRIIGTDIVHAIPLTLLCGVGHLGLGNIDWEVLAALLVGSVPGIAIGSRATAILPDWALRLGLSAILLLAAYLVVPRS